MSTTADLNDYSSRVNITGVTIASIPIDIVAQTIGNIAIDIAAASMGAIAISINVADIVGNLPIDIVAQTIGNITIDIAAQTVGNIGIDIAANSFGTLPIDIVAQTVGDIGISLNANTAGNITVDIAAQTMVGNLTIDIAANSFGNLPIDIVAQTIGNIGINLAANTLGNLTIDIAAQTLGNIAIDVAAQTVDLNIKTSGGVNIIIDQLEQGAYLDRRSTLSNDNGVTAPTPPPLSDNVAWRSKFFPRGCRGLLAAIQIYCKRTAAGTITVNIAPTPGMGAVHTITVTPGAAWAWVSSTAINEMWNYDSMFIWLSAVGADVLIGYDTAAPVDSYLSGDSGATWAAESARRFYRVVLQGETVGDIPVSGTLNTIAIPAQSTTRLYVSKLVATIGTDMQELFGSGTTEYLEFKIVAGDRSDETTCRVYCDGILAFEWSFWNLNDDGYAADTPGISLLKYLDDGICVVHITLKFSFRRSLKTHMDTASVALTGTVEGLVNLIK